MKMTYSHLEFDSYIQHDKYLLSSELSVYLQGYFLDDLTFDKELWAQFFRFGVRYVCQKHLQVEGYSETKRMHVLGRLGDRRELMCQHLVDMWIVLGSKQVCIIVGREFHRNCFVLFCFRN